MGAVKIYRCRMKCPECSTRFTVASNKQQFCSTKCRMRAYRRRVAATRKLLTATEGDEIRSLREENARLRQSTSETTAPEISFPIAIEGGGRWMRIKSAKNLEPGMVIRLMDFDSVHVLVAKEGASWTTRDLEKGTLMTLSMHEINAEWRRHSRARLGELVSGWEEKRAVTPVKDWEKEAKRLQAEVRNLAKRVADLQRPDYSMAVVIDKAEKGGYVARQVAGNEWDRGDTPKEALGALVMSYAISRTVTIESVEFGY